MMNRLSALPLLALVALSGGCDEGTEEDDQTTIGDFFDNLGEEEEEEDPYEDDECLFLCARVTAAEIGGLIGLPEDEATVLLADAGHEPRPDGDRLVYTVVIEDIDELALLSATE